MQVYMFKVLIFWSNKNLRKVKAKANFQKFAKTLTRIRILLEMKITVLVVVTSSNFTFQMDFHYLLV
jgi:hypothetical protein